MVGSQGLGDSPLDNVVWWALQQRQKDLAVVSSNQAAAAYAPDVSIFMGADRLDQPGWDGLAELAEDLGFVLLFRREVGAPPVGWKEMHREEAVQFVANDLPSVPPVGIVELTDSDAADMAELVALTEPGPWRDRTHQMGRYVGVRREGQLVAMAGERMRVPGFVEVSAVCVHPDAQRQGLGAAVTLAVAHQIRAGGDEAFLHVRGENNGALALYESIGFAVRNVNVTAVLTPPQVEP